MEVYFPTFGYFLADSKVFRILAQLNKFLFIQVYSEPLKYLANFRHYSRATHAYSERYLGRLRHI